MNNFCIHVYPPLATYEIMRQVLQLIRSGLSIREAGLASAETGLAGELYTTSNTNNAEMSSDEVENCEDIHVSEETSLVEPSPHCREDAPLNNA